MQQCRAIAAVQPCSAQPGSVSCRLLRDPPGAGERELGVLAVLGRRLGSGEHGDGTGTGLGWGQDWDGTGIGMGLGQD